jgi:hypothetical protein
MHMLIKLKKHSEALIIISALIAVALVYLFRFTPQRQFVVLSILVLLYLAWALVYHHKDKSLRLEIIIEYILTASLALVFFYGILL